MSLLPDQINRAWKLWAQGWSYSKIGESLGCDRKTVKMALHPFRRSRPDYKKPYPNDHKVIKRATVPPNDVLEQRDRAYEARMSAHLTIGQALLGDPLPGQSALDKRKSNVHSR